MKLFTSSIFYMITFLFIIGRRFTEVYSQYNHHPVPADIALADLKQSLEDIYMT